MKTNFTNPAVDAMSAIKSFAKAGARYLSFVSLSSALVPSSSLVLPKIPSFPIWFDNAAQRLKKGFLLCSAENIFRRRANGGWMMDDSNGNELLSRNILALISLLFPLHNWVVCASNISFVNGTMLSTSVLINLPERLSCTSDKANSVRK